MQTAQQSSEEAKAKDSRLVFAWRWWFVWCCIIFSFGLLVTALLKLYRYDFDELQEKSDRRMLRTETILSPRGKILDRHGVLLGIDVDTYQVALDVKFLYRQKDNLNDKGYLNAQAFANLKTISRELKLPNLIKRVQKLRTQSNKPEHWILSDRVDNIVAKQLQGLFMDALIVRKKYQRYYIHREVFSHLVGYVNRGDHKNKRKGLAGVEAWLNNDLSPQFGYKKKIIKPSGDVVEIKEASTNPIAGKDVHLTVDYKMQYFLYRALYRHALSHKAKSAMGLLVEVPSGEIRAMVSQPDFNPQNVRERTPYRTRFRAKVDYFEPGSTFKPLLVAAGLESGKLTENSTVNITRTFKDCNIHLTENRHLGEKTISEVLKYSINTGIVKLSMQVHPKWLYQLFKKLNLSSTDYNLLSGERGISSLSDYAAWGKQGYCTRSYGYGMSVNMRELISFYVAIANKGVLPPIHLLPMSEYQVSQKSTRVVSEKTAATVAKMLNLVVKEGGGRAAKLDHYPVAGKTGTARKVAGRLQNGNSQSGYILKYRALFVGFAPYDNPKYVLAIMVDEPSKSEEHYTGGRVAAPIFREVMQEVMRIDY